MSFLAVLLDLVAFMSSGTSLISYFSGSPRVVPDPGLARQQVDHADLKSSSMPIGSVMTSGICAASTVL